MTFIELCYDLLMDVRLHQTLYHVHQLVVVLLADRYWHEASEVVTKRIVEMETKGIRKKVERRPFFVSIAERKGWHGLSCYISKYPHGFIPLQRKYLRSSMYKNYQVTN